VQDKDQHSEHFASVLSLQRQGRYWEALKGLEHGFSKNASESTDAQITRAELLEILGDHRQAQGMSERLRHSPRITPAQLASCENILGRVLIEDGRTDEGTAHLQRAAALSAKGGNLRQLCWIQSKLLAVVSDRSGPEAATPLLSDLRRSTTKLGDPETTAQLHMFVGEMEARRGLLNSAVRHVRLGQQLIAGISNLWLEGLAENILLAVCVLRSQLEEGKYHSERALSVSEQCGSAASRRSAAANTGSLLFISGEFDRAVGYFETALSILPSKGNRHNGVLEALAQTRLAQGRFDECNELLQQIESTIHTEGDRAFYAHRYAEHTRAKLLAQQGMFSKALSAISQTIHLSRVTGDHSLLKSALLTNAEILQRLDKTSSCVSALREVMSNTEGHSSESLARFEFVIARSSAHSEQGTSARQYLARAKRICEASGDVPTLMHLEDVALSRSRLGTECENFSDGRQVLHSFATAMLHPSRPELVAAELGVLLTGIGCCSTASVEKRSLKQSRESTVEPSSSRNDTRRFLISDDGEKTVELVVGANPDIESEAALALMGAMIEKLRELDKWRMERERRSNLWAPDEFLPLPHCDAVLSGQMRELTTFAQRVARTTVNVLITGGMDRYEYRQNRGSRRAREDRRVPRPGSAVAHWSVPAAA
jgi:tetratricopeptide (TPR) repeat protein